MKKILVLGSAGFIMSNFIRYVLYRDASKEYSFASIDSLEDMKDYKRIYKNARHNFYLGDASDLKLMERVLYIEKPDLVINGLGPFDDHETILSIDQSNKHLYDLGVKIIQLSPSHEILSNDIVLLSEWQTIESRAISSNGKSIRIPSCFGWRQKHGRPFEIIKGAILELFDNNTCFDTIVNRYVYVEDVCSLIWYSIENKTTPTINMPALGAVSDHQFYQITQEILGRSVNIVNSNAFIYEEPFDNIWKPDSTNLKDAFIKTMNWYLLNKGWVF